MKNNWTQILVFTVLALVLGFVLGRVTGHKGHHGDKRMEKRIIKKHHGEGEQMVWHEEGAETMIIMEEDGDALSVTVSDLESSGFEGDTLIDGAQINITRQGDEVQVEVKKELTDSEGSGMERRVKKIIEKEVEVAE